MINNENVDLNKRSRNISELYVSCKYQGWFSADLVHSMEAYSLSTDEAHSPGIDLIFKDINKNIHVVEVKYTKENQSNNMLKLINQLESRKKNIRPLLSALELAANTDEDINSFALKMQNNGFNINQEEKIIFSACLLSSGKYTTSVKKGFQKIIIEIKSDNEY